MPGQQPGSRGFSLFLLNRIGNYSRVRLPCSNSHLLLIYDVATRLTEEGGGLDLTPEVVRSKFPSLVFLSFIFTGNCLL